MSIASYHRIEYIEIICSRIKIVDRHIHFRIKTFNNILFSSLQNAGTSDSHLSATGEDIQEQENDEEDDEGDLT